MDFEIVQVQLRKREGGGTWGWDWPAALPEAAQRCCCRCCFCWTSLLLTAAATLLQDELPSTMRVMESRAVKAQQEEDPFLP